MTDKFAVRAFGERNAHCEGHQQPNALRTASKQRTNPKCENVFSCGMKKFIAGLVENERQRVKKRAAVPPTEFNRCGRKELESSK